MTIDTDAVDAAKLIENNSESPKLYTDDLSGKSQDPLDHIRQVRVATSKGDYIITLHHDDTAGLFFEKDEKAKWQEVDLSKESRESLAQVAKKYATADQQNLRSAEAELKSKIKTGVDEGLAKQGDDQLKEIFDHAKQTRQDLHTNFMQGLTTGFIETSMGAKDDAAFKEKFPMPLAVAEGYIDTARDNMKTLVNGAIKMGFDTNHDGKISTDEAIDGLQNAVRQGKIPYDLTLHTLAYTVQDVKANVGPQELDKVAETLKGKIRDAAGPSKSLTFDEAQTLIKSLATEVDGAINPDKVANQTASAPKERTLPK